MEFLNLFKQRLVKLFGTGTTSIEDESDVDIGNIDIVHILKGCGVAVLVGILGAAKGIFSSYPFGLAFLCVTNRFIPYTAAGLIISALFNKGYAFAMTVVYIVAVMMRYALGRLAEDGETDTRGKYRRRKCHGRFIAAVSELRGSASAFDESILIRCAVAGFGALVFGLYRLIEGGFLYFDLFGLIAGFILTPLTVLVLFPMFCENEAVNRYREISRCALIFVTVFALRDISVMGFTPSFAAAWLVTLWISAGAGSMKGCAVGLFAGLACGGVNFQGMVSETSLAYSLGAAPCLLALAGLVCGALIERSRALAVGGAALAGIFLGITVDGYAILTRLIPDIFVSSAIFMFFARLKRLPGIPVFAFDKKAKNDNDVYIINQKHTDTEIRIGALSEAFAQLSETVYALSDRLRRPGVIDLKNVCTNAFDSYCKKCAMASRCLEHDCAATLDAQSKITAELYKKGRITEDDVPKYLRERCYNIIPITRAINEEVGRLIEQLIKNDKTEAFALDYDVMSTLLADQINTNAEEYRIDGELTEKLHRTLEHFGCPNVGAICYGNRRKQVIISGVEMIRMRIGASEFRRAIENTLGMPMTEPHFGLEDDNVNVSMFSERQYSVEVAKASGMKSDENANGDSVSVFENREDYFYAIISDGMGSGREAAITSKICVTFMKKMLAAGNGKAVTLKMLNGFIKSRGSECSATVDLAEIDLIHGKACFVKSGAAPSFVVRGGSLYKLQSNTAPIGILEEIDAEQIRFDLKAGDVIIMLSDGITQSLEDGVWLANLITYEWEDRLEAMAEKILDNAVFENKRSDDMTVVLVRVSENVRE